MSTKFIPSVSRSYLDDLYLKYNRREYIAPDPLEFVWRYDDPMDREVVGLLASSLAYGRVAQINRSVSIVLEHMGCSPRAFVEDASRKTLLELFEDFKHRFTTPIELVDFILGIKRVLHLHDSLHACFMRVFESTHKSTFHALCAFVHEIRMHFPGEYNSLLPHPNKKSACKRLHLYLRWMVRKDDVDPGVWNGVSPSLLIVPLDTHMFAICSNLGMTCRAQSDIKTALEITECFKTIIPDDPVKYDFALTRLGIRPDADFSSVKRHYADWVNG
jgi:uncharacterized protein (TIGR02757 family)